MSRWFPDVEDHDGVQKALNAGMYAAIAFCAMIILGMLFTVLAGRTPVTDRPVDGMTAVLVGNVIELAMVAAAAWRFKIGKGLVWGSFVLILFAVEIVSKVLSGTTNIGWVFFYFAVAAGLINGLRGAWARRTAALEHSPLQ